MDRGAPQRRGPVPDDIRRTFKSAALHVFLPWQGRDWTFENIGSWLAAAFDSQGSIELDQDPNTGLYTGGFSVSISQNNKPLLAEINGMTTVFCYAVGSLTVENLDGIPETARAGAIWQRGNQWLIPGYRVITSLSRGSATYKLTFGMDDDAALNVLLHIIRPYSVKFARAADQLIKLHYSRPVLDADSVQEECAYADDLASGDPDPLPVELIVRRANRAYVGGHLCTDDGSLSSRNRTYQLKLTAGGQSGRALLEVVREKYNRNAAISGNAAGWRLHWAADRGAAMLTLVLHYLGPLQKRAFVMTEYIHEMPPGVNGHWRFQDVTQTDLFYH